MMSESCPQDSEQLTVTALLSQTSYHRHGRHRSGEDAAADHSSSTEGPDSPCASSSGSPVPMMMPVPPYRSSVSYDDDDFERDVPRYRVVFTGDVSKDGDALKYRMLARSLASSASADSEPEAPVEIERQWEDFDHLHRQLVSRHAVAGVIVPPLPPKPAADAREAEARSRRRVGSSSFFSRSGSVESAVGAVGGGGSGGASTRCYVQGDDFDRDCAALSAYLEAMLAHPHFGRSPLFVEFLEQQEPPSRTKTKKGIFSGMKQSLDFGLKMPTSSSIKDPDEFFAKEREWTSQYGPQLKEAGDRFQGVLSAQLKLARQLAHLATAFAASVGGANVGNQEDNGQMVAYNNLNSRFSSCLTLERRAIEAKSDVEENTMGVCLSLWTGYMEAEIAMLARRMNLLNDRGAAMKAFTKASTKAGGSGQQHKLEDLRRVKEEKENELERCSKTGKAEVRRFHQRRLTEMRDALVHYAEGQISSAKDACEELSKGLGRIRDFQVPQQGQQSAIRSASSLTGDEASLSQKSGE